MSTRIPLLLGAAQFGAPNTSGVRVTDLTAVQELVDVFFSNGQVGIDTARFYAGGTSEELVGRLDFRDVGRVDTKNWPMQPGGHSAVTLKETFEATVKALNGKKIRVYYLHKPDRSVPYEETLEAINDLYKAGGFEQFGISNYAAWEVAEIVGICARRGFIKPTVYQGVYNLLDRLTEAELFPCLRKLGLAYAAYMPLASGFLTEQFALPGSGAALPSKFDARFWAHASFYTSRYFPGAPAVAELREVAHAHGLTLTEVALRWLQWHSKLQPGDHGVVVGANKIEHLRTTLADSAKGPLPEPVVQACEDVWTKTKGKISHTYFF